MSVVREQIANRFRVFASSLLSRSFIPFFSSLRVSSVGRARDIVVVFVAAILPSIYIYVVRMRCASTSIALPNDVERIGKVDRLKSIMLGDDREGPVSIACGPARSLTMKRPRYPAVSSSVADLKSLKGLFEYVTEKVVEYLVEELHNIALRYSIVVRKTGSILNTV